MFTGWVLFKETPREILTKFCRVWTGYFKKNLEIHMFQATTAENLTKFAQQIKEALREISEAFGGDFSPKLPITSFEAKKWLEVNFPSRGKVIKFPSSRKNSFFSNPSFPEKTGHFKGKGKLFSREIIPERENFPSQGKFAQFSLGGKFCLKRCLGGG